MTGIDAELIEAQTVGQATESDIMPLPLFIHRRELTGTTQRLLVSENRHRFDSSGSYRREITGQ